WWSSPVRINFDPDRRQSDRTHRVVSRYGSTPARNRHRFASHARHWHRPEWSEPHGRETPCDKACRPANADTLLCREDCLGKSVERTPSPDTDPNRRTLVAGHLRRSELHSGGTRGPGGNSSTGRKRFGLRSPTIVAPPRAASGLVSLQIAASQFPSQLHAIEEFLSEVDDVSRTVVTQILLNNSGLRVTIRSVLLRGRARIVP